MANILLSVVTLWLTIKGSMSTNTLESTPPSVNGVLTACAGQQILLTCSHNINIAIGGGTLWRAISPLVNCSTVVSHAATPPAGAPCGPFMFVGITPIGTSLPPELNSTAVANATVDMTDTTLMCSSGNLAVSQPVGNISLCIVASPTNIECQNTSSGLMVTWKPVIDDASSCARAGVNYSVTLGREPNDTMPFTLVVPVTADSANIANTTGLDPSARYFITVYVDVPGNTCMGMEVNVTCDTPPATTSPTEPPTSPPTMPVSTTVVSSQSTPPPNTTQAPSSTTSTGLSTGAIAAIAVVVIVLIFLAIVIVIVVVIILMISSKGKKNGRGGVHAPLATDPEHDSLSGQQQQAPVYAMVDKSKKTSAEQPTYQDPATIQHETAESGDLYAVSEKKGKAAKADVAAELYSEVDKSNRSEGGLTYASIEVEAKKKPTQKETEVLYSDIQH